MTHSIFLQHLVLAVISAGAVVIAALIGATLNRKMSRIEIAVNGRIDQLLREAEAKAKAEALSKATGPA